MQGLGTANDCAEVVQAYVQRGCCTLCPRRLVLVRGSGKCQMTRRCGGWMPLHHRPQQRYQHQALLLGRRHWSGAQWLGMEWLPGTCVLALGILILRETLLATSWVEE